MKILVIEDEVIVLKAIEFKLAREGYEVILAADGEEGMEKITEHNPDLIISDVMMPYANGLEILSYLRITLQRSTPLVMLSAIGQEDTVVKALEMGADDYITKPFSPNELLLRIKKLLIKRNR
jgi:Response regulators consisting of a CheY-like receiver domain and a winged-helix DNA-binding domain